MNYLTRFISEHFDDDEDNDSYSNGSRHKREEERFYRDLDRGASVYTPRKSNFAHHRPTSQKRDIGNGPSERSLHSSKLRTANTTTTSPTPVPVPAPPPMEDENVLMSTLISKDKQIAKLERELSTNSNIKTFGKRMAKLEKDKNEELEEVKKHYKSMMENIAKQAQRANERHEEEINKNTKLRETMDEMRHDMATREQDLEEKIIALGKLAKESNSTKESLEQKVEQLQSHAMELDKKLKATMLSEKSEKDRNRNLEAKFDFEKREMIRAFEKEKDDLNKKFSQKESGLKHNQNNIQIELDNVKKNLELEEHKHEETFVKLQQTERALMEKDRKCKELERQIQEIESENRIYRRKAEKEIQALQNWKKEKYQEIKETTSIQINSKLSSHSEMKELKLKLEAAEKKIQLQEDLIKQKAGALKRKTEEFDQLHLQLNLNPADIISSRDPDEAKPTQVNVDELKEMMEQLLAEKLSLENQASTNNLHKQKENHNAPTMHQAKKVMEEDSRFDDMEEAVVNTSDSSTRMEEHKDDSELRTTSSPKKVFSSRRSTTPIRARTLSQLKSKMSVFSMNE